MKTYDALYIDGAWTASTGSAWIDIENATTQQAMGRIPAGTAQDAQRAAAAARRAQPAWGRTDVATRARLLRGIADGLERRADELLSTLIGEVGTPRRQAGPMQLRIGIDTFRDTAALLEEHDHEQRIGNSLVVFEPVGVVGAITPWNYPLYQTALKVAPALAAGCTVVLKPSEIASLNAFILAEAIDEAGLPAGVFNLVSGTGPVVGEAIASSPDVDMVSFTGSSAAGRRVATLAGQTAKKVALELGGKSASVVLADADLAKAVAHTLGNCFANAGQTCAALTRLIVPRERLAETEQLAVQLAAGYRPGDPDDPDTTLGPVISAKQRDGVLSYIEAGIKEGARLLVGGPDSVDLPQTGYFVPATVFTDVAPDSTIAQEEIFGPVLVIIPVDDEDEAVAVANGTRYGLSSGVWAGDQDHARAVGSRLDAGAVFVNGGRFNPAAPFGGCKQSGYGRERGRFGLDEFLRTKSYHL
jgi:acyl-CoA reductase-like NAD-dependent aldehyde dehydrogenase